MNRSIRYISTALLAFTGLVNQACVERDPVAGLVQADEGDNDGDPPGVSNDEFGGAEIMAALPGTDSRPIGNASASGSDPQLSCVNGTQDHSVWYRFTAVADMNLVVETWGSEYDTAVAIFRGPDLPNLEEMACQDDRDPGADTSSLVSVQGKRGSTYHIMVVSAAPVAQGQDQLSIGFRTSLDNTPLVIFSIATGDLQASALSSMKEDPGTQFEHTYNHSPGTRWVLGDWDADGVDTMAYYNSNGRFYYKNDRDPNSQWEQGPYFGFPSTYGVVAGRFDPLTERECLGVVDGNISPTTGELRFSLKYLCDVEASGTTPLPHWLASPLPDAGGHTGEYQFTVGDWDMDGIDEIAVRRGRDFRITHSDPAQSAVFQPVLTWPELPGPNGLFVAGDWDSDDRPGLGVAYGGTLLRLYFKNNPEDSSQEQDLSAFPGPYQSVGTLRAPCTDTTLLSPGPKPGLPDCD